MSSSETSKSSSSLPGSPPARMRRPIASVPDPAQGSRDARRMAAAILEVLAGTRTPADAAAAVGISLPRYYVMEARALAGMVSACEPRIDGRIARTDRQLARLEKDLARARRECTRYQTLARATQRTLGLAAPAPLPGKGTAGKKRRRKPSVRALKAARVLQSESSSTSSPTETPVGPPP